jgi:hypothetical protein
VIQWLDELDDLIAAIGLVSERIRNFFRTLSFLAISLIIQCAGVLLALRHPPLALATAMLLFVTLLYRSVTVPRTVLAQSA